MPRPLLLSLKWQEFALQACVCMGQFLSQASITMSLSNMNIVLASFSEKSGETVAASQKVWFMGSYALSLGTFILFAGRLGDLFGLRRIFIFGWFWAALWALVTGLSYYSTSSIFFIVCRALQGIGFACILPCGMGILGTVYPVGRRKNFAFGFVGASAPAGATVGCILSAVISQLWWWCWAFWLLAIVCAAVGVVSFYAIPALPARVLFAEAWRRFDIFGTAVGVAGLVLFNFVWNQGPVVGWLSAYVIVLLCVSVAFLCWFFHHELRVAAFPLLPRSIFTPRIGLVLLCISLGWGLFGIWQYYYWSFMMNLRRYTPIATSLTYFPFLVLGIIASLLVGMVMSKRTAPYIVFGSMVGFMCGCIFLCTLPVHQTFFRQSFGQMFLLAWGMDLSFPAAALVLSDFLPVEHQGMAGSLVNTVVNYSVSLFLAMASTPETEVFTRTGSTLAGYRAAVYLGVGISGLAVAISVVFIILERGKGEKVRECSPNKESLELAAEAHELEKATSG